MSKSAPSFAPFIFSCVLVLVPGLGGCGSRYQDPPIPQQPMAISVTPNAAAIAPGTSLQFSASGDAAGVVWFLASATAGVDTSIGSISASGTYTAPSDAQSFTVTVTAISKTNPAKFASANVYIVASGVITTTNNVQVAQYTISPASSAEVSVQFGLDTSYGLATWMQPTPAGGGPVSIYVAGMKAETQYHMRGVVQFADGTEFLDQDQTFKTGAIPAAQFLGITATSTAGTASQSGVELLALAGGNATASPLAIVDLNGDYLWSYSPGPTVVGADPIKLLPNGHFLINFNGPGGVDGDGSILQEVDLSGTLIWQLTSADLNSALAAATCIGCNINVTGTHHDFVLLPNGHLIVIAGTQRDISGTTVTGDVLIDLDTNHKPVWLWNEFDYLDVNRQPMGFPDWTHTNAVLYSPDDGNLIISIRHQNWLIKVDYANGSGAGDIIWKLGYQGDFTLIGGTDPTDWFYAQHGPSFVTKNTTGKFTLALFDNGDDRVFPSDVTCGTTGATPCLYSTVPILELDETARTATLIFNPIAPTYSFFGGNAAVLSNGHVEYCESAGGPGVAGDIYEVTQDSSVQTVWHMFINGQYVYRGQRIPSLYPGMQW
jgi:arylsulfate sulfotransferase